MLNVQCSMFNSQCSMNTLVLANGEYPKNEILLEMLEEADQVVCCDGAANAYIRHTGKIPAAIVGDGDSINPRHRMLLHKVEEQETNDLTKAMHYLKEQGVKKIDILGATGKREDHTLGNISLLIEYLREGFDVRMFTDDGVFIPCHDLAEIECVDSGQPVSIFNFGATGFQAEGLKYPVYDFTNWWQGTLNEAVESDVTIRANGDFLIYLPYY